MKDLIKKKLDEATTEYEKHHQNLKQLQSAQEKCAAVLNSLKGKIEILTELLK